MCPLDTPSFESIEPVAKAIAKTSYKLYNIYVIYNPSGQEDRNVELTPAVFKNIVWDYTRRIADKMNNIFNPMVEKYGLTLLQVRILFTLQQHPYESIGGLAHRIHVAGTNLSPICKKLEKEGLIQRLRDREDERVINLVLTEAGAKIVEEIDAAFDDKMEAILPDVTEQTLQHIIEGLKELNSLLEKP